MSEEPDTRPEPQPQPAKAGHNPVFLYKDSGIQEKHGSIPLWLLAVVVILFIWGIYYLVAFWSPPPA